MIINLTCKRKVGRIFFSLPGKPGEKTLATKQTAVSHFHVLAFVCMAGSWDVPFFPPEKCGLHCWEWNLHHVAIVLLENFEN